MSHVFISYVRENSNLVDILYKELKRSGITVWLDRESVAPGEQWKSAIRKAIQNGAFFIACFSKEYNTRSKSYMNEELHLAIEELRLRSPYTKWFIPVLLSESAVPDWDIGGGVTLRDLNYVPLYENWNHNVNRIIGVIKPIMVRKKRSRSPGYGAAAVKAAEELEIENVKNLIEMGADINSKDRQGNTILHWLARWDQDEFIRFLIEQGADVNTQNKDGFTPLHLAAQWGQLDVAKVLINNGANINAESNKGYRPLDLAKKEEGLETETTLERKKQIVDILKSHGAIPKSSLYLLINED